MAIISTVRLKPLKVMLPTIGAAGDVYPFIALGLALQARGHQATILTYPQFEPLIKTVGLGWLPVGTTESVNAMLADPNLFHPKKGWGVVAKQMIVPAIAEIYRLIKARADADTVVAAHCLAFGARVAQDQLGLPTATVHLVPSILRSLIDQGMVGNLRMSASQPKWLKQLLYYLLDSRLLDPTINQQLNEFRATLGLPPVDRVLRQWFYSPQCVIGMFPEWFAKRQPDWPAQTQLLGFLLWDGGGGHMPVPPDAEEFLSAGEPPVIFTPGSAGSTMQRFFQESVEAARQLGVRAMLVTNFPEQLPHDLPSGIKAFGYLPFSEVLPRAALLVYHGGIGTLAQTIKAGIPHLVVPNSHDQFDNGWRIERLGLGRRILQTKYQAVDAVEAIRAILGDIALKQRCREYAARMDTAVTVTRACELIEGLAVRH